MSTETIDRAEFTDEAAKPSNNKVIEIARAQKKTSKQYLVEFWVYLLAVEAIEYWSKSQRYPISFQKASRFLGIDGVPSGQSVGCGVWGVGMRAQGYGGRGTYHSSREGSPLSASTLSEEALQPAPYNQPPEHSSPDIIKTLQQVKSEALGNLFNELEIRAESVFELPANIEDSISLVNFFEYISNYLEDWYTGNKLSAGFTSCSVTLSNRVVGK